MSAGDRPVLITGAAGLVGTHVATALAREGWPLRALVRNAAKARERLAVLPAGARLDIRVGDLRQDETLAAAMEGVAAVVHLAAIAIESPGQDYESINTEATRRLIAAAEHGGVKRFVHMSQNGASSASPYRFLRSKGLAQDAVMASSLEWTVLRPSVIFGPEDEFVNVLARLVRLSPIVFAVPGGGTARFQPIAVDDVAAAVMKTLDRPDTIRQTYALGGPVPLTLRQMTERILVAMGTQRLLVPLPIPLARALIALAQRILPAPPVTTSLLELLALDNTVEGSALRDVFGVTPTPFAPETLGYLREITAMGAIRSLFSRG